MLDAVIKVSTYCRYKSDAECVSLVIFLCFVIENHWDDVISVYKEIEMPSHPLLPLPRHGVPRSPADTAAVLQTQEANQKTMKACIERVHASVRGVHGSSLEFLSPHVIDLAAGGFIGPHVDSLKFSGKLICGLSLSSTRVLRLVKTKSQGGDAGGDGGYGEGSDKEAFLDAVGDPTTPVLEAVIRPRSLYIMANVLRYEFTHEVLGAHSPVPSLVLSGDADADGELAEFGRRVSFMIRDTLVEK